MATPTQINRGGQISGMGTDQEDGAFDQREIEKRPDVLVYTTSPLDADIDVAPDIDPGPPETQIVP